MATIKRRASLSIIIESVLILFCSIHNMSYLFQALLQLYSLGQIPYPGKAHAKNCCGVCDRFAI